MDFAQIKLTPSQKEAQETTSKIMTYEKQSKQNIKYIFTLLNIHSDAQSEFKKIKNQTGYTIKISNYFDLYKLSIFFDIEFIRKIILSFYTTIHLTDDQVVYQVCYLHNHLHNDLEAQYFDDFLEKGNIITYFCKGIQKFIKMPSFQKIPHPIMIKILSRIPRIDIPSDSLYSFIAGSISERVNLLRFLNFYSFTKSVKNDDFKQIIISLFTNYDDLINGLLALIPNQNDVVDFLKKMNQNSIASNYLSKLNASNKSDITSLTFQYQQNFDVSQENSNQGVILSQSHGGKNYSSQSQPKSKSTRPTKSKSDFGTEKYSTRYDDEKFSNDYSRDYMQSYKQGRTEHDSRSKHTTKNKDDEPQKQQQHHRQSEQKEETNLFTQSDKSQKYKQDFGGSDYHNYDTSGVTSHKHFRPLSDEDKERAVIWQKTDKILKDGYFILNGKKYNIKESISKSIEQTKTIRPKDKISFTKIKIHEKPNPIDMYSKVAIENMSSFEAARQLKEQFPNERICVLNFASAVKPGGGVLNGRNAQEETLSRMSSLYLTLIKDNEMYEYNISNKNPYYSDYMIFSPNVVVFRDDDYNLIEPYEVSVISSAAVNCSDLKKFKSYDEDKVVEVMKNRCKRILEVCLSNDISIIVLGAFGCGVFENKPEKISEIFRELIVDEGYGIHFFGIVFAIMSKGEGYTLNLFKKVFKKF